MKLIPKGHILEKIIYHEEYTDNLEYWQQIRTFIKGRKEVQNYLQNVTTNISSAGKTRNKEYKERAKFVPYPARTRNALIGSIFRKPAKVELQNAVEFLLEDANGSGMSLDQSSKALCSSLIEVGRHGVMSKYDEQLGRSKIVYFSAENMPYWETDENGRLTTVDLFTSVTTFSRLKLDEDGLYIVDRYTLDKEELTFVATDTPTKADGSRFKEIPFVFCGSTDNSPDCDDQPLWGIVDVTQGIYQNSADLEDFMRYIIPTPAVTIPNKSWYDNVIGANGYQFGSGAVVPIPEGGQAIMLQANANQMHAQAIKDKENQLLMIGARLMTSTGPAETAEAVKIKYSSDAGVLSNLTANASDALRQAIAWCMEFEGAVGDFMFELNQEFFDTTVSPQQAAADMLYLDRGAWAMKDLRAAMRKSGLIAPDRTDEEIDNEIELMGGGL